MKIATTFHFEFVLDGNPKITFNFNIPADSKEDALKRLMVNLRKIANECEESLTEAK